MNEIPVAWNKNNGDPMPAVWKSSDRKELPEIWESRNAAPEIWSKAGELPAFWADPGTRGKLPSAWTGNGQLPELWGKTGTLSKEWGKNSSAPPFSSGGTASGSRSAGASAGGINISGMARTGAGMFSGAAKKLGSAAKGAAESAAGYAKSDEFKGKLNAAKGRAGSLAAGAGSALTGLKNKAGSAIDERKTAREKAVLSDDINDELPLDANADIADDTVLNSDTDVSPSTLAFDENSKTVYASDEGSYDEEHTQYPEENNAYESPDFAEEHSERMNYSPYEQEEGYYEEYSQAAQPKGSKAVPVLLAIIGVLLAGSGVLGGMLIMKNKNDKTESAVSSSEAVSATEAAAQTAETPTAENVISTEATAVPIPDDTLPKALKQFPAGDISKYPQYIEQLNANVTGSGASMKYQGIYDVSDVGFALYDLNSDNKPELIIVAGNPDIYAIDNGKSVELTPFWNGNLNKGTFVYDTGCISLTGISGNGQGGYTFFKYNGGSELETVDSISFDLSVSSDTYEYNGQTITQAECDAITAHYGNKINISTSPISSYLDKGTPTMEEYNDRSNFIALGKVITQGDPLNMRKTASSSSEILVSIPKDSYVGIISETGSWYYAKYYQDTNSPIYYGYVSKDHIQVTEYLNGYSGGDNYHTYDISAAGSDFKLNTNVKECKVVTESGTLNLRAAPSTNAAVIKQLPQGATVFEYGHDHVWSYISYNADGTNYYGYVSKQYISDNNENVQVHSCSIQGTINGSKGEVSSFDTSYVVNGGAPKLVRKTLGSGWHIKAVNYCNSKDILWYEIYDADDGDYYGWVDSAFLDLN